MGRDVIVAPVNIPNPQTSMPDKFRKTEVNRSRDVRTRVKMVEFLEIGNARPPCR